ncbi:MAG: hypothetical protein IH912_04860 [Proteobacteria bacterium]|nr:hypothetical protein [Pseudomonadota bacterium]
MFKAIRITVLLLILFFVAVSNWLTQSRSTDWNNSLWVKIYPINGDGSNVSGRYIDRLKADSFEPIESFVAREIGKYGHSIARPVRVELGEEIREQPPTFGDSPSALDIMLWSLKMRWWANSVAGPQDDPDPDVRIFVRYHAPADHFALEDSVGMQKGMVGIVNAYAGRRQAGTNNVIIAHEFLHTLGATDKYDPLNGMPDFPTGFAEPGKQPRFPQRLAEIMGGRIAISPTDAMVPKSLDYVTIGPQTAEEIRLVK